MLDAIHCNITADPAAMCAQAQMASLNSQHLAWQQHMLAGRLAALREDADKVQANERVKVRAWE